MRIAVLGSTRGSTFEGLMNLLITAPELSPRRRGSNPQITLVFSNKPTAGIIEKAKAASIQTESLKPQKGETRESYDKRISAILENHNIDCILLIGYMRILSKWFTDKWHKKILNVHPSLLPKHKGLMDLAVHQAVLDAGETETGCSVHYVTEVVDAGTVVMQQKCQVDASDTAETLKSKVQALEARTILESLLQLK